MRPKKSAVPVPAVVVPQNTKLLTVEQAATYLGATVWCIRRLLMRGAVPYVKVGKRFNVTREDLDAHVERSKQAVRA